MVNLSFELDKLRTTLRNKGLEDRTIELIVNKAGREVFEALREEGDAAMQRAIEAGVAQRCPEFINDLQLNEAAMEITTSSGNLEFTQPPFPMLDRLLTNAKPIKDGSGVYKVIPIGSSGTERPKVSTNIYDAAKQINAERIENAKRQYQAISPTGKRAVQFRTATSKQDPTQAWVRPATHKDFTSEVKDINKDLADNMEQKIRDILRTYEEGF